MLETWRYCTKKVSFTEMALEKEINAIAADALAIASSKVSPLLK